MSEFRIIDFYFLYLCSTRIQKFTATQNNQQRGWLKIRVVDNLFKKHTSYTFNHIKVNHHLNHVTKIHVIT